MFLTMGPLDTLQMPEEDGLEGSDITPDHKYRSFPSDPQYLDAFFRLFRKINSVFFSANPLNEHF